MTLRDARLRSGMSVRQAAVKIGVFPSTVVEWELHGRMPRLETLKKAAEIYGVNPFELLRATA